MFTYANLQCEHISRLISSSRASDRDTTVLSSLTPMPAVLSSATPPPVRSDPYLRAVFRLNNYHYILKCTQHSGLLDLVALSEPTAEANYNSLIMEQKRLYSQRCAADV